MRPIRSLQRNVGAMLATGGVLAALGLTATPMVSVWHARQAEDQAIDNMSIADRDLSNAVPGEIAVELRDNADVAAINRQYGIQLRPNSIEANDDHIFIADLPASNDNTELSMIDRLRSDSRVSVAEPDRIESFPNFFPTEGTPHPIWVPDPQAIVVDGPHGSDTVQIAYNQPDSEILRLSISSQSSDAIALKRIMDTRATDADPFDGSPNDPRYAEQWNFRMIGTEDAWKRTQGKGAVVAVIDTGVAITQSPKGAPCRDFADTAHLPGYNFVDNNDDAYDDHAHGTHVAGTIAESTNNNEGVAGIAYNATILPVKVLSAEGGGTAAGVADGIRWAADHGAKVINMSLGSPYSAQVIHNACKYAAKKGVAIICAAGNSFGGKVGYPAAYPECIAVSAVGPTGKIAKYSSFGKQVALAAPGGDYVDSRNPADGILQNTNYPASQGGHGDDYYAFQGTSMACPHVAGVAALIEAQGITDPARVREVLTKTAVPQGDANKYGAGILSASAATARAAQMTGVKVRHWVLLGVAMLALAAGGRRKRYGMRLAMIGALAIGMFGPDLAVNVFGADSAWNLVSFSALLPILAFLALRRGPGVKVAGMLALGVAVNLFSNNYNDTLPFTTSTFGDSALPWTMANMGAALALGCAAAFRAAHATRNLNKA